MIGSAVGLTFNDFLSNLAPIIPVIMLVTLAVIYLSWGRELKATDEARNRIMQFREHEAITDARRLKQSLSVLALVIVGFILAHPLHLEPASIAMFGAGLLLLITNLGRDAEDQTKDVHSSFGEVARVVDDYVLQPQEAVGSEEPEIKALAIMEENDTSYLFVVDDGEYQGVITIQGIADAMSKMYACAQHLD